MHYVIIGNSAAGIGAAEGIRSTGSQEEITIITSEPHHTYSRPLISYLLQGKVSEEGMKYRADSFYEDNRCTLINGTAVSVNPEDKSVTLSDGRKIPYGRLLVASGSLPFVPPAEGLDTVAEKHTFMSLDDAKRLGAAVDINKKVLIIGAGLTGLKCAEGISGRAGRITVLDLAPKILSSILDDGGAELVKEHLERKGIEFILSAGVSRFEKNTAVLENGDIIGFDILVLAAGARPDTSLLEGIAKTGRGIIINSKSETSAPGIYAAGDCTESADVSSGQNRVMALLPNAYMQGECAGINMAGAESGEGSVKTIKNAVPMNAIGFFGLHIITAGTYTGEVYEENRTGLYKRLFYSGGRLNGCILIGDIRKAGIYTSLIRERTMLDTIDFSLICRNPGLMAFTAKDRHIKLGGVNQYEYFSAES